MQQNCYRIKLHFRSIPFFIGLVGAVALDERTVTVSHVFPSTIKIPAVAPAVSSEFV